MFNNLIYKVEHRIRKLIIKYLEKKNYKVTKKEELKFEEIVIENYFKTNFEKNALVSFITYPFTIKNQFFYHTNIIECTTICDVLNEIGYNVDVTDYDKSNFEFGKKYDLLVGFGQAIDEFIKIHPNKDYKIILYRNGCDSIFSDAIVNIRLNDFYKKYGKIVVESSNIHPLTFRTQIWFADAIIVLGNNFVANTFRNYTQGKIHSLDLFYYDVKNIDLENKDFSYSKNNFLWFGSRGAIRKGLDITLEFFNNHKELNLYICGFDTNETIFYNAMFEYFNQTNIFNLGFIKMESPEFFDLLYKCAAVIFPTAWEGGGGAVVNLLASAGLIPIVTKNLGIDFENEEFIIDDFTANAVEKSVNEYLKLTDSELKTKSEKLLNYFREKHKLVHYKEKLKTIIKNSLI